MSQSMDQYRAINISLEQLKGGVQEGDFISIYGSPKDAGQSIFQQYLTYLQTGATDDDGNQVTFEQFAEARLREINGN